MHFSNIIYLIFLCAVIDVNLKNVEMDLKSHDISNYQRTSDELSVLICYDACNINIVFYSLVF